MPLFAPALWAKRVQALDAQHVAEASTEEVKRQVAVAAAEAYLTVIGIHRVVESQIRARDTAKAFYDYAASRLQAGAGSKLAALQAQQTLSARRCARRAGAARALPRRRKRSACSSPPTSRWTRRTSRPSRFRKRPPSLGSDRSGRAAAHRHPPGEPAGLRRAAHRRRQLEGLAAVGDGIFQPALPAPGFGHLAVDKLARRLIQFGVPVFDAGNRRSIKQQREATLQQSARRVLTGQLRQARAEIRRSYESVRRSEQVLRSTVPRLSRPRRCSTSRTFSFRAGAATNLDVIDAQRRSRDADTAVAIAEDQVRQSRLDLLTALGRFPCNAGFSR